MANQLTQEHAKAIYDLAISAQRNGFMVYATRTLYKLVELDEPFYTPLALSALSQCLYSLGQREREIEVFKLVTRLTNDQQQLLNPVWVALCYQRTGDLRSARVLVDEILDLSPNDAPVIAAKAEIALLSGDSADAQTASRVLRARPEPAYQILARAIDALALAMQKRHKESRDELLWIANFIISSGSIPTGVWDYRDLKPLADKIGMNEARLVLGALSGALSVPDFIDEWQKILTP